jgi:predicted adenylyl cyclase CyaB
MPINLEIKAHLADVSSAIRVARSIRANRIGILLQKDTYYRVPSGRLKLRQIVGDCSELIFYDRNEASNERKSNFHILSVADPVEMHKFLTRVLSVVGIVSKKRILYITDGIRIHIDKVKGLGSFLELEVPVTSTVAAARGRLARLVRTFDINKKDFIKKSYIDYRLREKGRNKHRRIK